MNNDFLQSHLHHCMKWRSEVKSLSRVRLFATPWTVAYQAPPSIGFSRQEYWSGLPFPSPGDLPDPGIEPRSPTLQADALTTVAWRSLNSEHKWYFLQSIAIYLFFYSKHLIHCFMMIMFYNPFFFELLSELMNPSYLLHESESFVPECRNRKRVLSDSQIWASVGQQINRGKTVVSMVVSMAKINNFLDFNFYCYWE